ncbi:unnamed protein product [Arctogadus glacialis]
MFSMASHERTESSAGGEDDAAAAGPGGRGGRPVGGGQADGEPEPEARAWWLAAPRRLWSSVNWRRGARTAALFAAVNSAFWFVAFSTGRVYCLLSLALAGAVTVATLKEAVILSESRVMDLWSRVTRRLVEIPALGGLTADKHKLLRVESHVHNLCRHDPHAGTFCWDYLRGPSHFATQDRPILRFSSAVWSSDPRGGQNFAVKTNRPEPDLLNLLAQCPARSQGRGRGWELRGGLVSEEVVPLTTDWAEASAAQLINSWSRAGSDQTPDPCLPHQTPPDPLTPDHLSPHLVPSWKLMDPGESGGSETEPPVSQAFKLFLQETSSFKQQNPGKFCLLVCSLCTFFAVLGRYIPGIVVSYVLILGVFLWPLISSQEFALWLKPVLQKLDFGVGQFLQRIKDNHERRLLQATSEKESIEADLSSLFPKLDSTACKEMSVSDTEVSDVTWTDNGTFNLSEGHTPLTDNSEDLDKEEAFIGGLPEFPSLDNGAGTNGDDDDDLSIGLPTPPTRARRPIRSKHTSAAPPRRDPTDQAMDLVNQMASDAIAAAVTAAIQERIEAAVGMAIPAEVLAMSRSRRPECNTALLPIALAGESESDSEVEDFELLDQSELEQLDKELGLAVRSQLTQEEGPSPEATPGNEASSPGFFSKLLGRH